MDGGTKWTKLTKGLPTVDIGRIGVAINWKNPKTVYTLVTAQRGQGGFFRSDDAGASWTRVGRSAPGGGGGRAGGGGGREGAPAPAPPAPCGALTASARLRLAEPAAPPQGGGRGAPADDCYRGGDPGYYNEIFVDAPRSGNHLVTADADVAQHGWREVLVGRADARRPRRSPRDRVRPERPQSHHHRQRRRSLRDLRQHEDVAALHQPAAVAVLPCTTDNAKPFYNVCGGMQDNGSICGPSRTLNGRAGIRTSDWYASPVAMGSTPRAIPRIPTSSTPNRRKEISAA